MFQKLKSYLKQEKKEILQAFIVMVIVASVYLAYLYFVGIPMTKAKNYYNQAYLNFTEGNYEKSRNALNNSLSFFYTQEAKDLLNKLP